MNRKCLYPLLCWRCGGGGRATRGCDSRRGCGRFFGGNVRRRKAFHDQYIFESLQIYARAHQCFGEQVGVALIDLYDLTDHDAFGKRAADAGRENDIAFLHGFAERQIAHQQ